MTNKEKQIYEANIKLNKYRDLIIANPDLIISQIESFGAEECYVEYGKILEDIDYIGLEIDECPNAMINISGFVQWQGKYTESDDYYDEDRDSGIIVRTYNICDIENIVIDYKLQVKIMIDGHFTVIKEMK